MKYIPSLNRLNGPVLALILLIVLLTGCHIPVEPGVEQPVQQTEGEKAEPATSHDKEIGDKDEPHNSMIKLKSFFNYSEIVDEKINGIQDPKYKESFYEDRTLGVLKSLDYFNSFGYADILIDNKVTANSIKELYRILKDRPPGFVKGYLQNSIEQADDSISLIVSSNYYDFDTGLSAYISDKYNIPYFIVSYKDGTYRGGRTGFKYDLDELDQRWKREGIYMEVAPFLGELRFARNYGGYDNIHFDKTKKEILKYLEELFKEYDTVYYFSNVHGQSRYNNKLLIYSSSGLEYLFPEDIASVMDDFDKKKRFVFIGHHCYSNFEKDLAAILEDHDNLEYILLSASEGKSVETNMLQAINYASDGVLRLEELEDISDGVGSIGSEILEHELGERIICFYETDIPGYIMEIECEGVGDLDITMETNFEHESIFYYHPDLFNQDFPD